MFLCKLKHEREGEWERERGRDMRVAREWQKRENDFKKMSKLSSWHPKDSQQMVWRKNMTQAWQHRTTVSLHCGWNDVTMQSLHVLENGFHLETGFWSCLHKYKAKITPLQSTDWNPYLTCGVAKIQNKTNPLHLYNSITLSIEELFEERCCLSAIRDMTSAYWSNPNYPTFFSSLLLYWSVDSSHRSRDS